MAAGPEHGSNGGSNHARPDAVHVINVSSPSYTGTTWLNLVLGGHVRAFTMGPPDRVWRLRGTGFDDACRVHAAECPFWPAFFRVYDPGKNFYLQLAAFSGRDHVVINNPSPEHRSQELHHPDVIVHEIRMVRDGRALAASFARHHETDFVDAIHRFARPLYRSYEMDFDREDVLCLRYEDLMEDREGWLERFSTYLGLDYGPDAFEFHKFDHHVTAGNHATISQLKTMQGVPGARFRDAEFYESQLAEMTSGGIHRFRDERWKQELGRRELFLFDHYCGAGNAAWGYEEDRFSRRERDEFLGDLQVELRPRRAQWREMLGAQRGKVMNTVGGLLETVQGGRLRRVLASPLGRRLLALALIGWLASLGVAFLAGWWLS